MTDLTKILVPQFDGEASDLVALAQGSKPLVALIVSNSSSCEPELLFVFEQVAEKFCGQIGIFWLDASANSAPKSVFPNERPPCILLVSSGRKIGAFSCASSAEGIFFDVEEAVNGRGWDHAVARLQIPA